VSDQRVQCLLVLYRSAPSEATPVGVAVFDATEAKLVLRFPDDMNFVRDEHMEAVAAITQELHQVASNHNAEESFRWLQNLDDVLFAKSLDCESVIATDEAVERLFILHCGNSRNVKPS
jgi:hypothetical protein